MGRTDIGLRELKKRMTRETISAIALKLTKAKGLSNVTIDEIAREAFVSPRTVSNYFPSKEEAVLAAGTEDSTEIFDQLNHRPAEEPPLESLCAILSTYARNRPDQLKLAADKMALEADNPTLRPYRVAQYAEMESMLRARIAARTGTDAETDVYPWLVASAAMAAMTASLTLWARSSAPADELPQLIREAFSAISAGLPAPSLTASTSAH